MDDQIKSGNVKFFIEDEVLICEFTDKKNREHFSDDHLKGFLNAISTLSNGRYFPLLIDLRKLKTNHVLSTVLILAKHPELKAATLSKSFVINSFYLQFVLIVFKRIYDPIIPNKIFTGYEKAIAYSQITYNVFNAQY